MSVRAVSRHSVRVVLGVALAVGAAAELRPRSGTPAVPADSAPARPDAIAADLDTVAVDDELPDSPPTASEEDALAADARTIAAQSGADVADVLAELDHQEAFDGVVGRVSTEFPETFGGSWTDANGDSFVLFKGRAPARAATIIEEMGVPVTITEGARFSLREMRARADRLHADLMGLGTDEVATGVRIERQRIEATVQRPPDAAGLTDEELLARLPGSARAPDISIRFVPDPVMIPAHSPGVRP